MAYRYTDSDGYSREDMRSWLLVAVDQETDSKRLKEAAWVLDVPANRNKIADAVRRLKNDRCMEEVARILVDPSIYCVIGQDRVPTFYQYGSDDGKSLFEDTVYGG